MKRIHTQSKSANRGIRKPRRDHTGALIGHSNKQGLHTSRNTRVLHRVFALFERDMILRFKNAPWLVRHSAADQRMKNYKRG